MDLGVLLMEQTTIYHNTKEEYLSMMKGYSIDNPMLTALNLVKPNSLVLSAGCGTGREVDYLVNVLKCRVVAVDIDEKAIELSKVQEIYAEYILGDMVSMKFENKFDYIVCLYNTINYLEKDYRKVFIETCYSNLKENGELILTTAHVFNHWRFLLHNIKYHTHYYPFPYEIDEWFEDTSFNRYIKKRIGRGILIRATK